MLKRVKLSSIKPNPYRHFGTYDIQEDKIDTLLESIESSGFWGETVIARPANPGYELAFGHHRWQAALEYFGEGAMVEISVRDLDNDEMLKMMARENNEIFDANAEQDIELVKAAIEAHVAGEIHLPEPKGNGKGLLAHDYIMCRPGDTSEFTRETLHEYLALAQWRVNEALGSMRLIKNKTVNSKSYEGLSPKHAAEMNSAVRKAERTGGKPLAKKVASEVQKAVKLGAGKRDIKEVADKVINATKKEPMPDINDVAKELAKAFSAVLGSGRNVDKLKEVIKYQKHADKSAVYSLKMALKSLSGMADTYSNKLDAPKSGLDAGAKARNRLEVVR